MSILPGNLPLDAAGDDIGGLPRKHPVQESPETVAIGRGTGGPALPIRTATKSRELP
jgi:hypothetical protein